MIEIRKLVNFYSHQHVVLFPSLPQRLHIAAVMCVTSALNNTLVVSIIEAERS